MVITCWSAVLVCRVGLPCWSTVLLQDHGFGLIMMQKGSEGHTLHGSSGPGFDPHQYYVFKGGRIHTGLTVVAWQFADVNPGDG